MVIVKFACRYIKNISIYFLIFCALVSCLDTKNLKLNSQFNSIFKIEKIENQFIVKLNNITNDSIFLICLRDSTGIYLLPESINTYTLSGDTLKLYFNDLPSYSGNGEIIGVGPSDLFESKTEFRRFKEIKYYGLNYSYYKSRTLDEAFKSETLYIEN